MQCPACGGVLTLMTAGQIIVNVCELGCGGMWFDQLELKRLDEPHESEGEQLLQVPTNPNVQVKQGEDRPCPKCEDIPMMQLFYSPKRKVQVDQCPECGGFWLDAGELREIRSLYASDTERNAHLEELIGERWGDEIAASEERHAAVAGGFRSPLRKVFGFLMPGFK